MQVETKNLSGRALNYAVAKCQGIGVLIAGYACVIEGTVIRQLDYDTSCAEAGPIIDREGISTVYRMAERVDLWTAYNDSMDLPCLQGGPTRRIAAMRCYVASKMGHSVEIPEECL